MCKISIIIPVYNSEKYIEQCLLSIKNQTFADFEVICVNDGSTDGSEQIIDGFVREDERFRLITQANSGASAARNTAIKAARGEFLMFLDSDDWFEPIACEMAYNAIISHDADSVMFSGIWEYSHSSRTNHIFNEDLKIFDSDGCTSLRRRMFGLVGDELSEIVKFEYLAPLCFKMYKRNIIDENNLTIPDIREIGTFEDGLFNIEYFKHVKKAVYIDEGLYHYRKDNDLSATTRYKPEFVNQWRELFSLMWDIIKRDDLGEEFAHAMNNRIAYSIVGIGSNILNSQKSARAKKKEIKEYISKEEYKSAIKEFEIGSVPLIWKPLFIAAKCKYAFGVYFMLRMMRRIRRKRNSR